MRLISGACGLVPQAVLLLLLLLSLRCLPLPAAAAAAQGAAAAPPPPPTAAAAGGSKSLHSLRFVELQALEAFAEGRGGNRSFPLETYNKAKRLFALLLQQAQQQQQQQIKQKVQGMEWTDEEGQEGPPILQERGAPYPRFSLIEIPGHVLFGASEINFGCRLYTSSSSSSSRSGEVSALLCSGRPPAGQRAVELSFGFQLPPAAATAAAATAAAATAAIAAGAASTEAAATAEGEDEALTCKIGVKDPKMGDFHSLAYLVGALGLCAALGYSRQVYVHPNMSIFQALPEFTNIDALGFRVLPSRYVPYPFSLPLAAVKPNPPKTAAAAAAAAEAAAAAAAGEGGTEGIQDKDVKEAQKEEASVGDLLPLSPTSAVSWTGIVVDPIPYSEALSMLQQGLEKALLREGPSKRIEHNCSIELGMKPEEFAALQSAGASSCRPGAPLLPCLRELRHKSWGDEGIYRLFQMVKLQTEVLVPRPAAQGDRMLHLLTRTGIWFLLQRLLGGPSAEKQETEGQRQWYQGDMQYVRKRDYKQYGFNRMGHESNTLQSEILRFAILFLDATSTTTYWRSLQLGCFVQAMGLVAALGSVRVREAPQSSKMLFQAAAAAAAAAPAAAGDSDSDREGISTSSSSSRGPTATEQQQASLLETGIGSDPQWEGPLGAYAIEHEAAAAAAAQQLPSGLLLKPVQPAYDFNELKALADATGDNAAVAAAATAAGDNVAAIARGLWLQSPVFDKAVSFSILSVPSRDGSSSFDLEIRCSRNGTFPITRGLVGWFSSYLCEPVYTPQTSSSSSSSSRRRPKHRLIGMEFEGRAPHRCGVSFLGNEEEHEETDIRGQTLLDIFLGLCWLHGFRAGWILDSVTDIHTREKMRYTMGLERGESFYEHKGFLFSIDTIKQRSRPESCLGFADTIIHSTSGTSNSSSSSSSSSSSRLVSGLCQVHRDLLQTPGFDPTVLFPLHEKAFKILQFLSFDCRAAVWQGCSSSSSSSGSSSSSISGVEELPFPLLQELSDGRCAFEHHPLWQKLAAMSPEHCGFGKRIGDCHAFVRKHLGCTGSKREGCVYLKFLYRTFIYPGGNPREKVPLSVSKRWDRIARHLAIHHNLHPRQLLLQLLQQQLSECSSSSSNSSLKQQMERVGITCDELLKDGEMLKELLQHSVLFIDFTGLPQFWVSAENDTKEIEKEPNTKYCPAAFAWEFITRMQGQLYRHRNFVLPPITRETEIRLHGYKQVQEPNE